MACVRSGTLHESGGSSCRSALIKCRNLRRTWARDNERHTRLMRIALNSKIPCALLYFSIGYGPKKRKKTRGLSAKRPVATWAPPLRRFAASRRVCYQGSHCNVNKRNLAQLPGLNSPGKLLTATAAATAGNTHAAKRCISRGEQSHSFQLGW